MNFLDLLPDDVIHIIKQKYMMPKLLTEAMRKRKEEKLK